MSIYDNKRVIDLTKKRTGYVSGGYVTWHNGVTENIWNALVHSEIVCFGI